MFMYYQFVRNCHILVRYIFVALVTNIGECVVLIYHNEGKIK